MAKKKAEGTYEETLNSSEAFFMKYKKPILIALAAIILIIAGIIIYKNYISGPREEKASTELAKSQTLFNTQKYSEALKGFQKIQAESLRGTLLCTPAKARLGKGIGEHTEIQHVGRPDHQSGIADGSRRHLRQQQPV